jgi:lipoprotein-anchoring transpeptidase ErfK/SrfK
MLQKNSSSPASALPCGEWPRIASGTTDRTTIEGGSTRSLFVMTRPGPALQLLRAFVFATVALISEFSIARADIQIAIETARQRMIVSVDGTIRWTWPVSTGAPGYRTPIGSYHVLRLARYHVSKEWDDAPMPHSIFFTGRGHAIHGTDRTRLLGQSISHGCVRLSLANAAKLFQLVASRELSATTVTVN